MKEKRCNQCMAEKSIHFFGPTEWNRPEGNKRYCTMCNRKRKKKYVCSGVRADVDFNRAQFPGSIEIPA